MNEPQLIWKKIFHFNGLKSSNLKDNVDLYINPQNMSFIYHEEVRNLALKNQQMFRTTPVFNIINIKIKSTVAILQNPFIPLSVAEKNLFILPLH